MSNSTTSTGPLPVLAAAFMLALLLLAGYFSRPAPVAPNPSAPARAEEIGRSVEDRPITVWRFGSGAEPVLIMASIHGSEGAGTPLAERLIVWLEKNPDVWKSRPVLVLPVANPDGLARRQRTNVHGVDLNRNFPADNRQDSKRFGLESLSEPESRALAAFLEAERPAFIVSIHQPLRCVDYDGPEPAGRLAEILAAGTGLPVKKLGARPGSLGAWFGETLQRPILTLELPPTPTPDPELLWQRYGAGLQSILTTH